MNINIAITDTNNPSSFDPNTNTLSNDITITPSNDTRSIVPIFVTSTSKYLPKTEIKPKANAVPKNIDITLPNSNIHRRTAISNPVRSEYTINSATRPP